MTRQESQPLLVDVPSARQESLSSADLAANLISTRSAKLLRSTALVRAHFHDSGGYAAHPGAVCIYLKFCKLFYVDVLENSFKARINLTVRWYDSKFDEKGSEVNTAVTATSCPVLWFANSNDLIEKAWDVTRLDSGFGEEVDVVHRRSPEDPPGVLYRSGYFTGVFSADFELRDFPLDVQCLPIRIRMWGAGVSRTSDYGRYLIPLMVCAEESVVHSEFSIYQPVTKSEGNLNEKQALEVTLIVARKPGFHLRTIVVPLFSLTTCTFAVFLLEPEALSDRLGLVFTMLLTVVAFKFIIADKLPKLTYMTYVDRYTDFCFVALYVICLENALAFTLQRSKILESERWWLELLGPSLCCIFWLCQNVHFAYIFRQASQNITAKLGSPVEPEAGIEKKPGSLGKQLDELEGERCPGRADFEPNDFY